jgi:hypothetical protein
MLGIGALGQLPLGGLPFPVYRIKAVHTKEGKERLRAY